jgi:hypothetical protein
MDRKSPVVLGVDLAGSVRRPTGVCILHGLKAETHVVFGDEEILRWVLETLPALVPRDGGLPSPCFESQFGAPNRLNYSTPLLLLRHHLSFSGKWLLFSDFM